MTRPCTCHPNDKPPQPCAERYALADCRVESASKRLAEWLGYAWDGLRDDGRITDRGFKPWCFNGIQQKQFQGHKQDVRDLVIEIAATVNGK